MGVYEAYFDRQDLADAVELEPDWVPTFATSKASNISDTALGQVYGNTMLGMTGETNDRGSMVRWTRCEDGVDDFDMLALIYFTSSSSVDNFCMWAKASGTSGNESGYAYRWNPGFNAAGLYNHVAGGSALMAFSIDPEFTNNTWYWAQMRQRGTHIQGRFWERDAIAPHWFVESNPGTHSAGYFGIGSANDGNAVYVDYLQVCTGSEDCVMPQAFRPEPTINYFKVFSNPCRVDGETFIVWIGEPHKSVDWTISVGGGSLAVLSDKTDQYGRAWARYNPSTEGAKEIQVTYGL